MDHVFAAATVDVAEGETIEFGKSLDRFRTVATGVHTAGKNLISDETLGNGAPYTLTWKQDVATPQCGICCWCKQDHYSWIFYPNTENREMYLERILWMYGQDGPPFVSTGDCWGTRQISWQNIDIFSDYIARTEAIFTIWNFKG